MEKANGLYFEKNTEEEYYNYIKKIKYKERNEVNGFQNRYKENSFRTEYL